MYSSSQISVMHSTTIIGFSLFSSQFTRATLISVKSNLSMLRMNMSDGILGFLCGFYVFVKANAGTVIRHRLTACLELRIDVEMD